MLEFGQADKIFQDNLLHETTAYKENDTIIETPEITPQHVQGWIHPLEEKQIHVVIHSRLIFGERYDKLSDNQKEAINAHAMETVQQIQQEQEAAQLKELEMIERAKVAAAKPIDERAAKLMT